jgi:transcriptional regulator with XRE-family HTH domain
LHKALLVSVVDFRFKMIIYRYHDYVSHVNSCFAKEVPMPRLPLTKLGVMVRDKRGERRLREVAKEITIGPATLMRIESGRIPDVETFGKVCNWLGTEPGQFLGFESKTDSTESTADVTEPIAISAHFRADSTPNPETVQALAKMLLFAMKNQPRTSTENAEF